jgi:hypothetical protein
MLKIYLLLLLGLTASLVEAKLYGVVAMISEGARYHTNSLYDGGETKDRWAQVTPVGLRQHENLGKLFKKQYGEQLGLTDNAKGETVVYTTTVDFNIESGLANLYGMYPLGHGQTLEPA